MLILIAEDERITRRKLQRQLELMGHDVIEAADGGQAWELFQERDPPLVICDWEMPHLNGLELVRRIRATDSPGYVYIVMLTGKSEKKDVVQGIEAGADDFVTKPFDRDELRARLNAGLRIVELEHSLASTNGRLRHELAVARELSDAEHRKHEEALLGESIPVRALRDGIVHYANMDEPVLLSGPTGAGQEAVARAIHRQSARRERPFIYVACAHLASVNESIFGFNADPEDDRRLGKALLADGGTLYLEGVETLNAHGQTQVIEFLTESAALRSKGEVCKPDVRVIASVSQQADGHASEMQLREALEQALSQHRLNVPSLAERKGDIAMIAEHIVDRRARAAGKALDELTGEAKSKLEQYSWPGNIRELQSVVERGVLLAHGTQVDIPDELLREGRRVGGYTLQQRLGEGGMGEVWLAQHSLLARPSAVKLIRQSALRSDVRTREVLEERFQREARATAQLRSPHTVELYDFGVTEEGDFYYVMEYLSGVDLHALVHEFGPVDPLRVVHFLKQASLSLGEAHLSGLVHRDIKPENLFVCQLGTQFDFLKVLDFGIVRTIAGADQSSVSTTGVLKGSPSCISPEAAQGEEVSFASDVYGLGCVAYYMLTGRHVFEAPGVMRMLLHHISTPPRPPSELRPELPKDLEQLVLRCLAKSSSGSGPSDANELSQLLASLSLGPAWEAAQAQVWWQDNLPAGGHSASENDTPVALRSDTHPVRETNFRVPAKAPSGTTESGTRAMDTELTMGWVADGAEKENHDERGAADSE